MFWTCGLFLYCALSKVLSTGYRVHLTPLIALGKWVVMVGFKGFFTKKNPASKGWRSGVVSIIYDPTMIGGFIKLEDKK